MLRQPKRSSPLIVTPALLAQYPDMKHAKSGGPRKLEHLRYSYRHGGVGGVLFSLIYKLVNRVVRLRVFRAAITQPPALPADLGRLDGYSHGLFSAAELLPFVDDPENELTRKFLAYAIAQGDTCYAIIDGDILANYCWNSGKSTLVDHDLCMDFRAGYIHRYRGFTRPSHRGRRLSSYNHAESLQLFAASGAQGFAGYVDADNYVSYRVLQRVNHLFPGFIVVLGNGPQAWIWHSPQARAWGFMVACSGPEMPPRSTVAAP